jgi:prepilin-type processing-associated H-X9-DG protein
MTRGVHKPIICYSRKGIWPDGRNVLYADGAVEFAS